MNEFHRDLERETVVFVAKLVISEFFPNCQTQAAILVGGSTTILAYWCRVDFPLRT
jgi:hypothetical protein